LGDAGTTGKLVAYQFVWSRQGGGKLGPAGFVHSPARRIKGAASMARVSRHQGTKANGSFQMKNATAFLTIAMITVSTAAFGSQTTGTVKTVDKNHDAITLTNGKRFTLPEGIEAETLKVGERVTIVYSTKAGRTVVSTIKAAR
jgi:Cu/Ag efflux protein CusF